MLTPLRHPRHEGITTSPASLRRGIKYEEKVERALHKEFGGKVCYQFKVGDGRVDAYIELQEPVLIEIKLTQTPDAYYQLLRYSAELGRPAARVVITRLIDRAIRVEESPIYLQHISMLRCCKPAYYVIPLVL